MERFKESLSSCKERTFATIESAKQKTTSSFTSAKAKTIAAFQKFQNSKKMKLIALVLLIGILAAGATIGTTIAITRRDFNKSAVATPSPTIATAMPATTIAPTSTTETRPLSTQFPAAAILDTTSSTPPASNGPSALVQDNCVENGMIALTFDDGPSTNIPQVLKVLGDLNVKATFFVNAKNIADFTSATSVASSTLKQIYDSDHQVGSHTMSHADLAKISRQQRWEQMRRNDEYIKRVIGVRPVHLRAPFLSYSPTMLRDIGSWGYVVAGVSLDTKDYEFSGSGVLPGMEGMVSKAATANPEATSFISLQHDFVLGTEAWLRSFGPAMQQKGFKFVTTEECLNIAAYR